LVVFLIIGHSGIALTLMSHPMVRNKRKSSPVEMFGDPLQKIKVCLRKTVHNATDTGEPCVEVFKLCEKISTDKKTLEERIVLIASITLK
jgi:hypothetical protein